MGHSLYKDETAMDMASEIPEILVQLSDQDQDKLIKWVAQQKESSFIDGMDFVNG